MASVLAFDEFALDPAERRLTHRGEPVDLSARYFDALHLLISEAGKLVTKDRFMTEVWRGVPVTDEALTQCIRSLRKVLGDDAVRPRFIETVPKYGYRFIGSIHESQVTSATRAPAVSDAGRWEEAVRLTLAGTIGGGLAGLAGGLLYGFIATGRASAAEVGGASILLVITCLCVLVALIGAAGVSAGIALASQIFHRRSLHAFALAGAAGGMVVGALAKLLGLDAFRLILGRSPSDITGALEGAVIGLAVGAAAYLSTRSERASSVVSQAALCGAIGGLALALLDRPMMAESLARLADLSSQPFFVASPLLLGAASVLEGAMFAIGLTLAMRIASVQRG